VIEREWREASDTRRATLTLAIIVVAGALLRFWALGAGIPGSLGIDEPQVMMRSVQMMRTGSLNPQGFFDYPGLYLYVQTGVACARFLVGAIGGEWTALNEAQPEDFYLWGRAVTALLGTVTVLLVYRIGLRWGTRYALLASALMAVMPLHVRESHYVLTDVPLTFFVTLALALAFAAHEHPTAANFAKAGAAVGLAAATKYPGAISILLPVTVAWMTPSARPSRPIAASISCVSALAVFLLAAPYTWLDLPGFLNGFARLASVYSAPSEAGWLTYLKHLRLNLHWPAMVLMVAGVALALVRVVRGPSRLRWMLAVVFPVVYFWFVSQQSLVYGRYLLPVVPFVCLLTAAAVVSGVSLLRRFDIPRAARTALIAVLTIAVLLPPTLHAIGFNRLINRRNTSELAYNWIVANVPKHSTVVIETGAVRLPAPYKSRNIRELREQDVPGYQREGVQYLVASSEAFGRYMDAPQTAPREYADYMNIFGRTQEIARFSPSDAHPGPELRVLRIQPSP
jgi:4-amino-4-deoxy-L-arabinose transferase-like glycosyltransferase